MVGGRATAMELATRRVSAAATFLSNVAHLLHSSILAVPLLHPRFAKRLTMPLLHSCLPKHLTTPALRPQFGTEWRKVCSKLEGDAAFDDMDKVDRLEVFQVCAAGGRGVHWPKGRRAQGDRPAGRGPLGSPLKEATSSGNFKRRKQSATARRCFLH